MKLHNIKRQLKNEAHEIVPDILDQIKKSPKFYVPKPSFKERKYLFSKMKYAFASIIILFVLSLYLISLLSFSGEE